MYRHRQLILPAVLALFLTAQTTVAGEHRQHGSQVHGIGHLNVVLDGASLAIELHNPAANIVGFEHAPHNDTERAQRKQALARLREGEALFVLPKAAGCRLASVEVTEEGGDHHKGKAEHAHEHQAEKAQGHSDIDGQYLFHCEHPAALDGVDVRLFEPFPALQKLKVQFVGPNGQAGLDLTAGKHYLHF
jgi:hypothetical protein